MYTNEATAFGASLPSSVMPRLPALVVRSAVQARASARAGLGGVAAVLGEVEVGVADAAVLGAVGLELLDTAALLLAVWDTKAITPTMPSTPTAAIAAMRVRRRRIFAVRCRSIHCSWRRRAYSRSRLFGDTRPPAPLRRPCPAAVLRQTVDSLGGSPPRASSPRSRSRCEIAREVGFAAWAERRSRGERSTTLVGCWS